MKGAAKEGKHVRRLVLLAPSALVRMGVDATNTGSMAVYVGYGGVVRCALCAVSARCRVRRCRCVCVVCGGDVHNNKARHADSPAQNKMSERARRVQISLSTRHIDRP